MPTPYKYLAFDPGYRTGVAGWDDEYRPVLFRILKGFDALCDFLDGIELQRPGPKVIIYERYRVAYSSDNYHDERYAKIHAGKQVVAEQAIGAIFRTARKVKAELVAQEPSILEMALLHAGLKKPPKGRHLPDDQSAYAHGNEYLLKQGLITPRVLNDKAPRPGPRNGGRPQNKL